MKNIISYEIVDAFSPQPKFLIDDNIYKTR